MSFTCELVTRAAVTAVNTRHSWPPVTIPKDAEVFCYVLYWETVELIEPFQGPSEPLSKLPVPICSLSRFSSITNANALIGLFVKLSRPNHGVDCCEVS
jgi:hypothetical protein